MMNINPEEWFEPLTVDAIIEAAENAGYTIIKDGAIRQLSNSTAKYDSIMEAANNVLRRKQSEDKKPEVG